MNINFPIEIKDSAEILDVVEAERFRKEVYNTLLECGISPALKGFTYIREAVTLIWANFKWSKDPEKVVLGSYSVCSVYEAVGKKYTSTTTRVERCIREAVSQAFRKGNVEYLEKIFSYTIASETGKVKNKEFLLTLSLYLIEQHEKRERDEQNV